MNKLYFITILLILAIFPQMEAFGQTITVTSPNGGESWQPGSFHVITFTDDITEHVKIDLYKGGVFDSVINDSTRSDGSTNWEIPTGLAPGSDYKVKITSVLDTTIFDFSDADFTIETYSPFVTVTAPNGGESWPAGSFQQITSTDNLAGNIKIDLYKGGVFDSQINASTASDGSTNWTIPAAQTPASDYRVKITSVTDTTVFDFSDADFTIDTLSPPFITVTSPDGGESWAAGSFQVITFDENLTGNVKIELYKGGVYNSDINASTPSDGSTNWTIPSGQTPGSDYKVKITSLSDTTLSDFSDADFTISAFVPPFVTVTSPNGGEGWARGVQYQITFTDNITGNVKLELYKGGSFNSVINASTPSDGQTNWTIPAGTTPGSDYKIKITSVDSAALSDFSDADFSIGSFELTVPNGGESWGAGTFKQIKWKDAIPDANMVADFELWKGGAFDRLLFTTQDADGSKDWDIPADLTPGSDYKIKIFHHDDPTDFDFSDADFTISPFVESITVTSPNGGESWAAGTAQSITWTDNITAKVKVDLYKGGVFNSVIDDSTTSDGLLTWNIPSGSTVGSDYTIKITSIDDGAVFDFSDANFSISAYNPALSLTSPNGGEDWGAGTQQTITWTDDIFDDVRLELWKGGVFNSLIFASTPSDGSKGWFVPSGLTPGTDYKVKIISVGDSTVFDFSDADFTVTGFVAQLTLDSPNGGEEWKANSLQLIQFTDNIDEFVRIHLYKGGVFHSIINDSTRSDGSTNWTIPRDFPLGTDYKVKITSVVDTTLFDFSDADFSIIEADSILVTIPNGGEDWMMGTFQQIKWIDNIPEIPANKIRFELWKGGVLDSVLFDAEDPDGSKDWKIEEHHTPGSDYKVKLIYNNNTLVNDLSDSNFTLSPYTPIITFPNGGESLQAGSAQTITWIGHHDGDVDVKVDLYKGGIFDSEIKNKTRADGSTGWTIPLGTMPGSDYKIRIERKDDSTSFDFSDADFTIHAPITVTAPNGGESWGAGTLQTITWIDSLAENVKIELYKAGVFDSDIATSTESDGSYIWNIPGGLTPASDYSVKITSVSDTALNDMSDANFSIFTPVITVTSPNGGENYRTGSSQTITWTDNIAEYVKIDLYKGGAFNQTIADSTESDGSHPWTVPVGVDGSDYTVVITSTNTGSITDVSDANFSIFNPDITVTSPNGGEIWQTGNQQTITWNDNISENVKIELLKAGVFNSEIIASTSSDGSYNWLIPASTVQDNDYQIKITSVVDNSVTDSSDGDFSIIDASFVTVSSPNGGEDWLPGTQQTITWDDNIIENVKIDLYKGGVFNSNINSIAALDFPVDLYGSPESEKTVTVNMTKPGDIPANVIYKITAFDADHGGGDAPEGEFYINGNGPLSLFPGATQANGNNVINDFTFNIPSSWLVDGANQLRFVRLYSTGFRIEAATLLMDGVSSYGNNTFSWNIPVGTAAGSDYTFKITSISDPNLSDFSDADFSITPFITVSLPNGGENYRAGTSQTITWTDNIAEKVKIVLFKSGVFNSTITDSTESDGSYPWMVPAVADGADYTVVITSTTEGTVTDVSDADFSIFNPVITVTSPNGGENYRTGTSQTITWTDNISEFAKIELYKAGVFDSVIADSTESDGSHDWTVPVVADGSDYTVVITSTTEGTVTDVSDADFSIFNPVITVTSPNGGENYRTGSSQTITWTDNIAEKVKIELFKGGIFNSTITDSTESDGSHPWTVPVLVDGADYTVVITSTTEPAVTDLSDAGFSIFNPVITVTSPNGGENYRTGTSQTITWTDNISEFVKIELYKSGVFDSVIADSTDSDGTHTWTVPVVADGADYTVVITSTTEGTVTDVSDADFSIFNPVITVTSPNGGENYRTGSAQTITWTDNISEFVKIELYKAGVFDSVIADSTESDGSHLWTVPVVADGADYTVVITSTTEGTVTDLSDADFSIFNPVITLTSPNGGENYRTGTSQTITWTDNISEFVKIELYKAGVFDSVIADSTESDGSHPWTVPVIPDGTDYTVVITSTTEPAVTDVSDAGFSIFNPVITVTSPNGGENYRTGTSQTITWTDNISEFVKIELYKSGVFDSVIADSTDSDGTHTWAVPVVADGADYTVVITSTTEGTVTDVSDADFSIFNPVITVTSPNGGENYRTGTLQTITWTDNITEDVKIELFKNGVFNSTIIASTPSDGTHDWTVPVVADGADYTVVITSTTEGTVTDVSDADFSIFNPVITVTSPNGGENYRAGTSQTITWTDNIAEDVKIELFKNGVFNSTIIASTPSDGTHDWTVPVVANGADYTVVITSTTEPAVTDLSDADFSIFNPVITLTSPNGGENYRTGTSQTVTWTDNIAEDVKIELFKGGVFNSTIIVSTPSDGTHPWTLPVLVDGADYTVVITSTTEPAVTDLSDADFSIFNPVITLTSPNGGENYRTGTSQTVTWTDNIAEDVKIELFKGGVFNSTIIASTPSDGTHPWTLPVLVDGADYTVVITSTTEAAVTDVSDADFSIFNPVITVTSPNGGENYRTGSSQTITWIDNIAEDVKIEIFKNGVFNTTIVASTQSDGSHPWTLPVVADGADYTVVITSTTESAVTDVSDADFSIFNPVVTVTSPNGGENYRTGSAQTINWTDNISEFVKIELYKAGVFDSVVADSTESDGSHDWTVSVVADGADYTVVIISTTEPAVTDVSDADFSIFNPVITVTSPNGGENYRAGTSQTITWTDNIAEDVKIELFKNGVFNSTIIASTPSDGTHDWTVPVVANGADYTVVITSTTEPAVTDLSDADFSIFNPVITLTSPNGGENYRTGTSQTVTWTDNIAEDVKIELFKGGVFNSTIIVSTPSDGTHPWTLPVLVDGADYTVVITSTTEPAVTDLSDADFSIFNPVITLTSPNGGENYRTGTSQTVTWTDNIAEDVKIELFKGGVFNSTIIASTPSDGTHPWTLPVLVDGADYTVVITSTTEAAVTDVSDADFSIFNPVITVTSPNGGENYRTGSSQTITWIDNIAEDVKIEIFKNGVFNTTIVASTQSDGSHPWTLPVVADGADYTVVITSTTEAAVTDVSDADFSIFNPVITVTSPTGGENYRTGTAQTITWTDNIAEDVKIDLFKGGVFNSTIIASTPSDGSHDWTVPVVANGADYTVVITSTTEPAVTDLSDADFSIFNPVITLTSPNGGENYRTGTSQTVTWTDNIAEDVKIELFKGGVFNSTIIASTPSDGTHPWTLPVLVDGADYTVVITSATEPAVTDLSDADFSIFNPVITVTSPNGGENYRTGTAQTITWIDNIAEDVKIEIFKNGVFNSTIVASTPSDGSHPWTVPIVADGADYTVVITSTTEAAVTDVSDADFSIFNPVVTVTSPNGGENYRTGSAQTINWTDNISEDVKIELFKGGVFNSTIIASTQSDGSHPWTVPIVADGADYTVVITSTTEAAVTDVSDADFSIFNPVITVTSPNGGENYRTGTSQTITWTDNIAEDVKIEIFKGGVFNSTIVASTPSDGSHPWTVPVVADGADYTVVITSTTEAAVTDVSDADFSIFNPVITVTSPNGGENYRTGSAQTITWTDNIAEDVKIDLFKGGVFNSTIIASTPSDGSHPWTVPIVADGADYTVVITSTTESAVTDVSDADFSIFNPVITVTSPNGGEIYELATAQTITWTDNISEDVKIELFKGGVFNSTIIASTPSDGSHPWTVPVVADGADYTVVITSTTESAVTDVSDADFTIFNPVITVTSPNGGEIWDIGASQDITWTDNTTANVKIELYKSGVFNSTIVASTASDGTFNWTVPVVTQASDYTVVITSETNGTVTDVSDANFTIQISGITVSSPNGGENYRTGSSETITWTDNIAENVKIELLKNGVFNTTISDSTESDGSHDWTVPVVTDGADYTVVITSTTEAAVTDVSDADFSIFNPVITVTSPNGGENYRTGSSQTITWIDNIAEDVKIEIFKNGVFNTTIVASTQSDGSHPWTLPVVADGADYTVVITSTTESAVTDVSDADFSIFNPVVTVTSPNGGENYRTGSAQTINWTDNISEDVKIELFKGGVFNSTIIASTQSDGSHPWTVPIVADGADYTVVITSTTEAAVTDVSDADFSIFNPVITVTSPTGGENYRTGTAQTITWTDNIAEDVKIDLFKGGVFNSTIIASTTSDGSHPWTVPIVADGADYTVVITSTTEAAVTDVSDADFSIFNPVITVTSPNGGENYRTGTSQTITWTDNIAEDVKIEIFKGGVFNSTIVASTPSDGSHPWTVPVVADGADYTVVITSTTEAAVTDVSDADFSIFNPVITVTSPNGGENYRTGSAQTITWTDNIAEDVKIDLFKGGVFNSTIIASTPSDGSHPWTVPIVADGADYTVVITSTTESAVTDVSDADFSIFNPVITVTSPNGGEIYELATAQTITWTDNISEDVKIELFKGGVFNSTIIASTPSDGSHPWTVPVVADGADYTVVITSTTESAVTDVSDADFTIFNPVITVTSPNGGEIWDIGASQDITWTDNTTANVKIELYKSGVFNSTIVASTASDGTFNWTVPVVTQASDYTVVITSETNGTVTDVSDANFTIQISGITVSSPNGGEVWEIGSAYDITWADNIAENIRIELFKGGVFNSTIVASTPSDGTYNWTVPVVTEASDYTVVVTSVSNSSITDVSDANFTLQTSVITLTSPNGGENYRTGTEQTITWTDNISEDVKIELFKGGVFNSTIVASTPSDGSHPWTVPVVADGADYTVVITSTTESAVADVSDADFTIFNPVITVTSPNGGENYRTGSAQTITWTDNIAEDVKIDLFKGGVFNSTIIASTQSDGSHPWTVPIVADGADYTVVITSTTESAVTDVSDADFSIFNPVITVTSPNGGEIYELATAQTITWTDNISEDVKIELFKGGVFNSTIIASTPSDGSHPWTVPVVADGADYTVVITSTTESAVTDVSDADFTIFNPVITVTSPNGGEIWDIGASQDITWTDNTTANVKIELYKSGVFNSTIVASTASDGTFNWTVPVVTQASDYTVVITSETNGTVTDVSDANFTIQISGITVSSPNGGEVWEIGSAYDITWADNIAENIRIELFKGGVFNSTIVASTPSDGTYNWTVPVVTEASDYTVVVTSVSNSSITDVSDANFTLQTSAITVSSPNGTESWSAGTTQNITWTDNINENITIDLYKGGVFNSVISTSTGSDGSASWDIPFTQQSGTDYRVKLTSVDDPAIFDFSDADFTIVGNQITVTAPNGGEQWLDTEDQLISWTDNLTGNVEIQLFKAGVFNSSIITSTPSDGEYTWNIPGTSTSGSDYKIKIVSVDDAGIFDLSDTTFTIINNDLTVVTPNGSENWLTSTSQEITWTDDISGNVKIDLYKADVFDTEISASTPSNGSFTWNIPGSVATGSDYKIRITSVEQPVLFDMSDASFTIFTGVITVLSPNGGESWQAGSSLVVTWADNITEDVTIDLYKGGVLHSVISTATGSDGSENWDIPFEFEGGSDYMVKITSVDNPATIFDFSDADFTIIANQITVTSPNGGEDYLIGSSQIIIWTDNITGNVEIQLFKAEVFHSSLTTSTASDGSYTWNISNSLVQGSDYKIRIASVTDGNIFDLSDSDFTLSNEVIVTMPNGGESWRQGTTHTINWTDNLNENVKIELFKGGVFDTEITASTPSNGSFSWDIPANTAAGLDYMVKITSIDNATVFDVSDANFEIFAPNITVVTPNGAESWSAGTTQNITWTDNINENITIDLYKGGVFNSVISTSTGSDGSASWDIPFTQQSGTDYRVKLTSVDDPAIFDFSDADFTIVGNQITVTAPNGGEQWLDTEDQLISWTDNLTGNVEIQLFKAGVFNSSIITSTPSDGEYTWNIPGTSTSGSDYKIKIVSVDDAGIFDLSDTTFTIINNDLTVVTPNGSENWLTSTSQEITWTDDISGNVKIDLYKADVFDTEISASTPSNGSFTWNIPGSVATGSDYKIRITSVEQPVLFDMSNASFTIFTGVITVLSPNGGESWMANSSQTISWDDNINGDVTIELHKADTLHYIISGPTSSDGAENWTLPFDIESGDDYMVKIISVDNTNISDSSNANFSIEGFEITITSPNGGEIWYVGQDYNITWTDNLTGSVEIQLFKGGVFHSVIVASEPSDGIKTWSIPPDQETGTDYTIKIASTDNSNIFDFSDSSFTLAYNIVVESPNGGESWQAASTQTITWSDNITGNVKLELHKSGLWYSDITSSAPSTGSYTWEIPADTEADTLYKIKIVSAEDTSVYDYSDNNFEIFSGSITVMSPNGGVIWQAGSAYSINWASDISENVKIELYKGGSLHSTIVASTSNDDSYNWSDMPFTIETGFDYQVRITSTINSNTFDFSDGSFTIVGKKITLTSPNGGENWLIGDPYFITWDDNLVGDVEIHLLNGDNFDSFIAASEPSDGTYTWIIPSGIEAGNNYKIRIVSRDDSNILDESDDIFTISSPTKVEELFSGIPNTYELMQNFPNPFNPSTTIYYALPEAGEVELVIYDVLGNEVQRIIEEKPAGYHKYVFNAGNYKSGVYIYRVIAEGFVDTKKMILMK